MAPPRLDSSRLDSSALRGPARTGASLGASARTAFAALANEHVRFAGIVRALSERAHCGDRVEVDALGHEAALRLSVHEELGEQVLYPEAHALVDGSARVHRVRLLHAHARVLVGDIRLEHGDPYRTALLAGELAAVCTRYTGEQAALVEALEDASCDEPRGLTARVAGALEQLLECLQPSAVRAAAARACAQSL